MTVHRSVVVCISLFLVACGDDKPGNDVGNDASVGTDGPVADASVDARQDCPANPGAADGAVCDPLSPAFLDAGVANPSPADAAVVGCNPVAQTGCGVGQKCAEFIEGVGLKRTTCVPDGELAVGCACDIPPLGFDGCSAGSSCSGATGCKEICSTNPNSCGGSQTCQLFNNSFQDTPDTGLCLPSCDTVAQDCPEPQGCYYNIGAGGSICGGTATPTQDTPCSGPPEAPTACFLNGCAEGYAPHLPDPSAGPTDPKRSLCTYYCSPASAYVGQTENAAGIDNCLTGQRDCLAAGNDVGPGAEPGSYQCRYLNTYYGTPDGVTPAPDSIGFCVPTTGPLAEFGDCTKMDYTGCIASASETSDACISVSKQIFCSGAFGCMTAAELDAVRPFFPALASQDDVDAFCAGTPGPNPGAANAGPMPHAVRAYLEELATE